MNFLSAKAPSSLPFSLSQRSILWIVAIFAFTSFLFFLPTLTQRLICPIQLQQSDAINVERALIVLRGENLYPDPTRGGPYLYTAYPPLYFWLEALLMKATHSLWLPGRLLAFIGYFGCGLLMGCWAFKRWGKVWALLMPSMLWIFPSWERWGTVDRPDTLFIFLQFFAFILLYRQEIDEGWAGKSPFNWIAMAGILEAAAILIKQGSISLLLAYGAYCFFKKKWKNLSVFFSFALGPVFLVCFVENLTTGGLFFRHTVSWLSTGYRWGLLWYWLTNDLVREAGWLLALVLILVLTVKNPALLAWQLLFTTFTLFSLGRLGGAENYWLEFFLFCLFFAGESIATGEAFTWVPNRWWARARWMIILTLVLLFVTSIRGKGPTLPSADEIAMKM